MAVRPTRESRNTQPLELRFRATLSQESVVKVAILLTYGTDRVLLAGDAGQGRRSTWRAASTQDH